MVDNFFEKILCRKGCIKICFFYLLLFFINLNKYDILKILNVIKEINMLFKL